MPEMYSELLKITHKERMNKYCACTMTVDCLGSHPIQGICREQSSGTFGENGRDAAVAW
jgi:hypothetical protein